MPDQPRCLIVSNLYPPHHIGGYELGCRDVVEALRARQWDVHVLTGDRRRPDVSPTSEPGVERTLSWLWDRPRTMPILTRGRLVAGDLRSLRRKLSNFRPDCVLVFNTLGLHKALLVELARHPTGFSLFISDMNLPAGLRKDPWFSYWQAEPRHGLKRMAKHLLRRVVSLAGFHPVPPDHSALMPSVLFASDYLRRQHTAEGLVPNRAAVVYWGVNAALIRPRPPDRPFSGRFLFVGQLRDDKGPQTAVAAAVALRSRGHHGFTLDLYGSPQDPEYGRCLQSTIQEQGLEQHVFLRGEIARDRLAALYAEYDVLVFPSVWAEPFSIALLEGMTAGLAVTATPTGGTPEILVDGQNARLFPPGSSERLADILTDFLIQPAQAFALGVAARKTVLEGFTLDRMVDTLSKHLREPQEAAS